MTYIFLFVMFFNIYYFSEVLNLLKKSQHECKEWKNKYRQSVLIMKRSELETNRFTKNIEELKLKQKSFEEENKSLTEQNAFLEERYNKQMLESMKTIKTLQDDLQMIQELKSEGSKSTDVNQNLNDQISDLVKENQKLTEKSKKEIKHLQNQNEAYTKEMSELKSQVCKTNDSIREVMYRICNFFIQNKILIFIDF